MCSAGGGRSLNSDFYCDIEQVLSCYLDRSQNWDFLLPLICSKKLHFTIQIGRNKPKKIISHDTVFNRNIWVQFIHKHLSEEYSIRSWRRGLKGWCSKRNWVNGFSFQGARRTCNWSEDHVTSSGINPTPWMPHPTSIPPLTWRPSPPLCPHAPSSALLTPPTRHWPAPSNTCDSPLLCSIHLSNLLWNVYLSHSPYTALSDWSKSHRPFYSSYFSHSIVLLLIPSLPRPDFLYWCDSQLPWPLFRAHPHTCNDDNFSLCLWIRAARGCLGKSYKREVMASHLAWAISTLNYLFFCPPPISGSVFTVDTSVLSLSFFSSMLCNPTSSTLPAKTMHPAYILGPFSKTFSNLHFPPRYPYK